MSRYGTAGTPHTAIVNAFEVRWSTRGVVYHYDGEMTPEWVNKSGKPVILRAAKGSEIMMRLQTETAAQDFPKVAAFDGKKNLFSSTKLGFSLKEYSVPIDRPDPTGKKLKTVRVKIAFVRDVNMGVLSRLIQSQIRPDELSSDGVYSVALNMLNLFVQAQPRRTYINKGKSFYISRTTSHRTDAAMAPLKLLNGFFQSVRPAMNRLILNVDITAGAILPQQPLVDACARYCEMSDRARLRDLRADSPQFMKLRQFLRGVKVVVSTDRRRREKTIKDIISDVGRERFDKDGEMTTVADHFRRMHNITIAPRTLGVRLGGHELIPIHECQVVNQLYKGRLQPQHIREVLAFIPQKPQARLMEIKAGWSNLGHDRSEFLSGANIAVSPEALTVSGRVLPTPNIKYGNQAVSGLQRPGVWDIMRKTLQKPVQVNCILTFNLVGERTTDTMKRFINDLKNVMQERGIMVRNDAGIEAHNPQANIASILDQRKRAAGATLIIAILPENAADLYIDMKRFGDIESGVVTQCVRWTAKIHRGYEARKCNQYHNNLILKINAKMGGINYTPDSRIMHFVSRVPTMIVGADVSHPSPGSRTPSIASLVASFDPQASRYAAFIKPQHSRMEIITDLRELMWQALNSFTGPNFSRNGPPQRIIIFRDGVSEGEFEKVRVHELGVLREFLDQTYQKIKAPGRPTITFIIVGKRHHYRFFPEQERKADQTGNCPPGLVVDRDITHPVYFDFYLQSQAGLKGTSVPSHYTVLEDENFGYRADDSVFCSYSLCHNYARATRSVKIPAPVYYADLVCRRAKFHYDNEVQYSENMSMDSGGEENHLDWFKQHFKDVKKEMLDGMFFL
ncbi:Piwi-domain-containing protein [Dendrothele bispora CBS 962.96]|uniref:Piwi-domain-containing protein n=1 Tax=Dendrothele bispora (strain CBS 962.96) TaxID=1314807 RepID=A0A4V4HIU3_DENBC|nr:Piwi-domain-containing protein [Dendrothele bispora CBS 962.96]